MPTVLDLMGLEAPSWVEGRSLLGKMRDTSLPGRDFTVTTVPFANPGDAVNAVDDRQRRMSHANVTTITTDDWALLYSPGDTRSELYNLKADPKQETTSSRSIPNGLKRSMSNLWASCGRRGWPRICWSIGSGC